MHTLKQLKASAIALKRKYTPLLFYGSTLRWIFSVLAYVVLIAVILYIFLHSFVRHAASGLSEAAVPAPFPMLLQNFGWQLLLAVIVITVCTGIFSYFVYTSATNSRKTLALQMRFVSGIAHELRTPLSVMRINNELARLHAPHDLALTELLDGNIADIDRINETLGTLLLYDQLVNTKRIQFEKVHLQKILVAVTSKQSSAAKQKNINLLITKLCARELAGNYSALELAISHVVENAIAYSPQDSDVIISCTENNDSVEISIKNAGFGIAENNIGHIFEPFYRSKDAGKLSGVGISLAVVEQIVRLHKGKISVVSTEKDGTEFTITLPLVPMPEPQ
jgi:signal transduction histidine kinase